MPQILALLRAHDLRATFFIPGRVAERHPERVREIMADGHEIGHHGYTHTSPANLDAAAEEDELTRALEVLRGFGADVAGYRSPSWDFSPRTIDLLEQHGFTYSSNLMDDIRPYRHPGKRLAELPIQWILDDAAHFWFDGRESWTRRISTPSEVREIWEAEFEGIRPLGGAFVLTMHPQVIGRPGRLPLLDGHDHPRARAERRVGGHLPRTGGARRGIDVIELLDATSARPALHSPDDGTTVTHAQLVAAAGEIAAGLAAAGVGSGDRVAVVLPNGPEIVAMLFATAALGAAMAPLNPAYTEAEYRFFLDDLDPRLLLVGAGAAPAARAAAEGVRVVELEPWAAGRPPRLTADGRGLPAAAAAGGGPATSRCSCTRAARPRGPSRCRSCSET